MKKGRCPKFSILRASSSPSRTRSCHALPIIQNPEEEDFLEECDDVIEADLSQLDGETYNNMVALNGIQYKTRCVLIVFKAEKTTHIWEKIKDAFPIPT